MNIGALIPARIGSKRLPKKNIIDLGGKPLVCWTIDVLLEANFFADITVSTESREVASIVQSRYSNHDVKVLMRPESLAGDDSPLSLVESHYLENRPELDWMGLFMPTMPFRKVEQLRKCHNAILSGYPWKVQSYTTDVYPILDYYYPKGPGMTRFFADPCFYCRMVDCTYMLHHVKVTPNLWNQYGLSHMDRTHIVHISSQERVDIDTQTDYETAQNYVKGLRRTLRPLEINNFGNWTIIAPSGSNFQGIFDLMIDSLCTNDDPVLILEEARPKLIFLSLSDGAQRRPWIDPQAASFLNAEIANKTGNMQYIKTHYVHANYCRVLRNPDEQVSLIKNDMLGGFHCMDGSSVPLSRIFFAEELIRRGILTSPLQWK